VSLWEVYIFRNCKYSTCIRVSDFQLTCWTISYTVNFLILMQHYEEKWMDIGCVNYTVLKVFGHTLVSWLIS